MTVVVPISCGLFRNLVGAKVARTGCIDDGGDGDCRKHSDGKNYDWLAVVGLEESDDEQHEE